MSRVLHEMETLIHQAYPAVTSKAWLPIRKGFVRKPLSCQQLELGLLDTQRRQAGNFKPALPDFTSQSYNV